jgi:hypothetical protein
MLSAFVPGMQQRGFGRVLNVASIAAFQPVPGLATYAATKAYVLSLTESLAEELRGSGVTVTALCPGITDTGMLGLAVQANPRLARCRASWSATSKAVAEAGYRACLAGDVIAVPGVVNQAATLASRSTPRWLVRRVAGPAGPHGSTDATHWAWPLPPLAPLAPPGPAGPPGDRFPQGRPPCVDAPSARAGHSALCPHPEPPAMTAARLILDHVYDHEAAQPDRVFLTQPVGGGQVVDYTWAQTLDQARRMAAHLQSLQLPPGARIAMLAKNSAHFFMAELAIWMAGGTTVAIFPTETADNIAYVLRTAKRRCCSSASSTPGTCRRAASRPACPASRCRWRRMLTGRAARPGTPSSRAPRRCRAACSAPPTTWRCCCTRRAPPASPRA